MTWLAQVRHVAVKDVRQMRWLSACYVVVVLLATAHALSWRGTSNPIFQAAMPFVVWFGMMLIASMIQADSPTHSDAFWASRPFYPSAVLAAKCCVAIVFIIGVGLVGQAIGLGAYGLGSRQMAASLARSAGEYGRWLLLAMVVAALTKDIPSFVVALVIVPVLLLVTGIIFTQSDQATAQTVARGLAAIVGVIGGLVLLVLLYRTRDTRRRTWVGGLIAEACLFTSVFAASPGSRVPALPASVRPPTLTVELLGLDTLPGRRTLGVAIHAQPGTPSQRLTLVDPVMLVRLRSGTTLRLPLNEDAIELRPAAPPPIEGITWPRYQSESGSTTIQRALPLTPANSAAVAGGVSSAALDGRVVVDELHTLATLPLANGALAAWGNGKVSIERWSHGQGDVSLTIVRSTLSTDVPRSLPLGAYAGKDVELALVNDRRHEGLELSPQTTKASSSSLVLPGPQLAVYAIELRSAKRQAVAGSAPLDGEWLRAARLVIVDWIPRGSYPVHAEFVVPTSPPSKK
jgi:hypothetical protein